MYDDSHDWFGYSGYTHNNTWVLVLNIMDEASLLFDEDALMIFWLKFSGCTN